MEVVRGVGVKIGPLTLDGHFAQKTCRRELVEGVVDCRERYRNSGIASRGMKLFGRQMPVPVAEQKSGQCNALPGRPQARRAQLIQQRLILEVVEHAIQIPRNDHVVYRWG